MKRIVRDEAEGAVMAAAVVCKFLPNSVCARQALSWADSTFDLWFGGGDSEEFTLIVGEMVSNAVQHGEGMISLYLRREGCRVIVAVSDSGKEDAESSGTGVSGVHEWGLVVVGALSEQWGVDEDPDFGSTVWAELAVA